jgi:hypothetical protein
MRKQLLLLTLIIVIIALSLMSFNPMNPTREDEAITVLFLIDNSGSMANSDPNNLRTSAARLFISLLDNSDSVGGIIFSNQAVKLTDGIQVIETQQEKQTISQYFMPSTPDGFTDVKSAFELASEFLNHKTKEDTIIVFLTDGQPEPVNPYPSYENDTIALAKSLNLPVISIALTSGGSTQFLTRLATETSGQVLSANTAMDLLDVYLQILSQWKHRTILGEGISPSPTIEEITIDPGLIPYTDQVSFVVSKNEEVDVSIINPRGEEILETSSDVRYVQFDDPQFSLITIEKFLPGKWTVNLSGTGQAQIRTVLKANLRAELQSPKSFAEAGEPLLVAAQIVEQQANGGIKRVIGASNFYAIITLPNGEEESLDQLYDDGSHGDVTANDGIYSRIYPNTELSGTYSIRIYGSKDLIPVQAQRQITLISFPNMEIISPLYHAYSLESQEKIPIEVQIIGEKGENLDTGSVMAKITNEKGATQEIVLTQYGNNYSGSFKPKVNGVHNLEVYVDNGMFHTLPYNHTKSVNFEATLIPNININKSITKLGRIEKQMLTNGIPISVTISSTSDQSHTLSIDLEGESNFILGDQRSYTIPGKSTMTMDIIIKSTKNVAIGKHDFQLIFTTNDTVSVSGDVIPVSIEIFEPTISIENVIPIVCDEPVGCLNWESVFILQIRSTSLNTEEVYLSINDEDSVALEKRTLEIHPGLQEIPVTINNVTHLSQGERNFQLSTTSEKDSIKIDNASAQIPLSMYIPSLYSRCNRDITWVGLGLSGLLIFFSAAFRKSKQKSKQSYITGTLQYWRENESHNKKSIDLTGLEKREVTIGKASKCDVQIVSDSIEEKHFQLRTQKVNGYFETVLKPQAPMQKGYVSLVNEVPLANEMTFSVGKIHFLYLSDSGY